MRQILCFGDSNTWGLDGKTGTRFPWKVRWTGILQEKMKKEGVRIIEEGLCGRTTVFEDPLRDGRRGTALFPTLLESHAPLDDIVIMLGTNDCKTVFGASAEVIGKGMVRLLEQAKEYSPDSRILLVSPIYLGEKVWQEEYDQEFSEHSVEVSKELEQVYKKIARERSISFLAASSCARASQDDQEHMDADSHQSFAEAVWKKLS